MAETSTGKTFWLSRDDERGDIAVITKWTVQPSFGVISMDGKMVGWWHDKANADITLYDCLFHRACEMAFGFLPEPGTCVEVRIVPTGRILHLPAPATPEPATPAAEEPATAATV